MAINLEDQSAIRKLKLQDLVDDAKERKDKKAIEWLIKESSKSVTRKREDGTTYEVDMSIVSIRAKYLKDFLKYKSKGKASAEALRAKKRAKRQEEREKMFADALKSFE